MEISFRVRATTGRRFTWFGTLNFFSFGPFEDLGVPPPLYRVMNAEILKVRQGRNQYFVGFMLDSQKGFCVFVPFVLPHSHGVSESLWKLLSDDLPYYHCFLTV